MKNIIFMQDIDTNRKKDNTERSFYRDGKTGVDKDDSFGKDLSSAIEDAYDIVKSVESSLAEVKFAFFKFESLKLADIKFPKLKSIPSRLALLKSAALRFFFDFCSMSKSFLSICVIVIFF